MDFWFKLFFNLSHLYPHSCSLLVGACLNILHHKTLDIRKTSKIDNSLASLEWTTFRQISLNVMASSSSEDWTLVCGEFSLDVSWRLEDWSAISDADPEVHMLLIVSHTFKFVLSSLVDVCKCTVRYNMWSAAVWLLEELKYRTKNKMIT